MEISTANRSSAIINDSDDYILIQNDNKFEIYEEENEDVIYDEDEYIKTLPEHFSFVDDIFLTFTDLSIQEVIELLGNCLGILDFSTNLASFWFLDILALQVIEYKEIPDYYYRGIFINWLIEEFQLIRRKNLSQKVFLYLFKELAYHTLAEIKATCSFPHIRQIYDDSYLDMVLSKFKNNSNFDELHSRETYNNMYYEFKVVREDGGAEVYFDKDEYQLLIETLRSIIKATYYIYGCEFRYNLIREVFINKIEQEYHILPNVIRKPRRIKEVEFAEDLEKSLSQKLDEEIMDEWSSSAETITSLTTLKSDAIISPPPPSLIDEEINIRKCEFILPLTESIEAREIILI